MFSPFKVFVGYFLPAVSADWLSPAFMVDVDFYVCAFAFAVPGVLATFNTVGHGVFLG
jgi:hypothetical protein